jgi:hypothetical protein
MKRMASAVVVVIAVTLALASPASSSSVPPCSNPPKLDPATFGGAVVNPYFPLIPGTTYRYKGEVDGERAVDVFTVTSETKEILGVTTTVVTDRLYVKGELVEDTQDWFATDVEGNVWYLGEDTRELEDGVVVSTEGSWEAGVDGANAGIFMPADPQVGQTFHQELARGVAEDCFEVLDLSASVDVPYVSSDEALQTEEWTRLDPEAIDNKYFVRDIGMVLDVAVQGGDDFLELVSVKTN